MRPFATYNLEIFLKRIIVYKRDTPHLKIIKFTIKE